jgi:hypothetical protein
LPRVEGLEGRELLSGVVTEIAALPAGEKSGGPMTVVNGNLWFAENDPSGAAKLGKLTVSGFRSEVALPNAVQGTIPGLTSDAQGNVWYSLDPPKGMPGQVGRVSHDGTVNAFPLTNPDDRPGAATLGPDGNIWVAVASTANGPSIARVAADGTVSEFPVKGAQQVSWLTTGHDGNLWFIDSSKVGKMTPAGAVTEFTVPAPSDGSAIDLSNAQLTPGSDGNLWFIGLGGISRITPTGDVKTYPTKGATITGLGTGADGNLWLSFLPPAGSTLTYSPNAVIARLTTDGHMSVLADRIDTAGVTVDRIAVGHDTELWLGEGGGSFSTVNLAGVSSVIAPIISPTTQSTLTAQAGVQLTGTVASFTPNIANTDSSVPAKYTAVIEWGDGGSSVGTVTANTQGGFDVGGTHAYNVPAGTTESLKITVSNVLGDSAVIFNQVQVQGGKTGTNWTAYPAGSGVSKPSSGTTTPTSTPATGSATTPGTTQAPATGSFGTSQDTPLVPLSQAGAVPTPAAAAVGGAGHRGRKGQHARAHVPTAGAGHIHIALVPHSRVPVNHVARHARPQRHSRY